MSVEQLKKAARNLQRLLPSFVEQHKPPYGLTGIQTLVCQMHGYPNLEIAASAMRRSDDEGEDELGSFYRYPWMNIDPHDMVSAIKGHGERPIDLSVVDVRNAMPWFKQTLTEAEKTLAPPSLIAIVAAGEEGDALVSALSEPGREKDIERLTRAYTFVSYATLSQRAGIAFNWLSGWSPADIKAFLNLATSRVGSAEQSKASRLAVDIIVDQAESERPPGEEEERRSPIELPAWITVEALFDHLQSLVVLSEGGWSKDPGGDIWEAFDEALHQNVEAVLELYNGTDLRRLVRPLGALLARLVALHDSPHGSHMGYRKGRDHLDIAGELGLSFICVDMDSKRLDHVMAMAALAKAAATTRRRPDMPADEQVPQQVVLVTR